MMLLILLCLLPVSLVFAAASGDSLSDLNDEALWAFMAASTSARHVPPPSKFKLPDAFWELEPGEGMRRWIDLSRDATHREKFDIVLVPKVEGQAGLSRLSLDDSPSQCYSTGSRHCFVSFESGDAFYASGKVRTPGGARLYDAVFSPTKYELTFMPIEDTLAVELRQRIESLSRMDATRRKDYRSSGLGVGMGMVYSTADGQGYLEWWTGSKPDSSIVWSGSLWSWGVDLAKRINYKINDEVRLNFANALLTGALPERIDLSPVESEDQVKRVVLAILERFSMDERSMSLPVVQIAAEVAGEHLVREARPLLEMVLTQAPEAAIGTEAALTELDDLQQQIWAIAPQLRDYGVRYGQSTSNIPEAQVLLDQREQLMARRKAIEVSDVDRARFAFCQSLQGALQKLALADDVDALKQWVLQETYGARWALRRLHEAFPSAYAEVLELNLQRADHPEPGEVLSRIYIADRSRGLRLAREWIASAEEDALFIDCFRILQRADDLQEELAHLGRLIALIRADYTNNYQRARSLNLLVPEKDAMRYVAPEVEAALLYVVDPEANSFPDKGYNYASAAGALLKRDAARYYRVAVEHIDLIEMPYQKEAFYLTLAAHAESLDPEARRACLDRMRAELRSTRSNMNSLLWVVWSNDWRELTPELNALATKLPEDAESADASLGNTERRAITGHFHLARQILALWLEPDAATRAKLYVAFAYQVNNTSLLDPASSRGAVFVAAFQSVMAKLDTLQRTTLLEYVQWCREQVDVSSTQETERLDSLSDALRELIMGMV